MLKKSLLRNLTLSFALLISACGTMPPDVPMCVEITQSRGHCTHIISGKEFEVSDGKPFEKKTWWEMRPTFLQVPASSWRAMKSYIISACKRYGNCQSEVSSWDRTLEIIDNQVKKKE